MITPTQEFRRTRIETPRELPKGLNALVDHAIGLHRRRASLCGELLAEAGKAEALSKNLSQLTDSQLKQRLRESRERVARFASRQPEIIAEALAAIRVAAHRSLGLEPFVVQLAGALAMQRGYLAEMATGEGKTLSAAMAAVLAGWTGRPCHVLTVNDYLARRDAAEMGPLFEFCGIEAGCVTGDMDTAQRAKGYDKPVTYCTGKEIVADFLRDRIRLGRYQNPARRQALLLLESRARRIPGVVMRGIYTAIVDEADSVMIDEAVTPVIIASPQPNEPLKEACRTARELAAELVCGVDYLGDPKYREVEWLDPGLEKLAGLADRLPGLWRGPDRRREIVTQALAAREHFQAGIHYAIVGGKIHIVDEFTGRIMEQRTWQAGLHQAIEAKESLEISDPTETLARLSFQRFFRFFSKLSGMTGTASESAPEFWRVYRLPVVRIPPNRPCVRVEHPLRILPTLEAKWDAVVAEVRERHARGQPVLIGTRSIAISELLSSKLDALEVPHRLLNALRDREEAATVAAAGQAGQITIATNMAGRGTDIRLGPGVAEIGGLHVIGTDLHDSRRVDCQLFGRAGRQGDPGSAQAFASLEDDLLKRFTPVVLRNSLRGAVAGNRVEAVVLTRGLLKAAQRLAQSLARRQRSGVLAMDKWNDDSLSFAGMEYC
jgi:preprotein translocase subunit SecA